MQLILASNSPRRRELLTQLGYQFIVEPSSFEERERGLSAHDTALFFARGKAEEVFSRFPLSAVLGADTVVTLGGEIFGKPKDQEDAKRMLRLLSGKEHAVLTGVCLIAPNYREEAIVATHVVFHELSEEVIAAYVASGLPLDKAGAYGIQDGRPLVKEIYGSYTNVVGLPTEKVGTMLATALRGTR
ncbi:MAG: septum formation protein Maf [Clostridia bacterium]|nr:septum formation protein Maf [Clostridia bacterium]